MTDLGMEELEKYLQAWLGGTTRGEGVATATFAEDIVVARDCWESILKRTQAAVPATGDALQKIISNQNRRHFQRRITQQRNGGDIQRMIELLTSTKYICDSTFINKRNNYWTPIPELTGWVILKGFEDISSP